MHGALGLAGGPGGKGYQCNVFSIGIDVFETRGLLSYQCVGRVVIPILDGFKRRAGSQSQLQFRIKPLVAKRMRDFGLVDDLGEFLGAQQRHGADADAARLEHRHPGRRHHRIVRAAQQHAIAGLEIHLAHQQVSHAVGLRLQLRIGAFAVRRADGDALAVAGAHHVVEKDGRAIHALRVLQLRQLEVEFRPLIPGRQIVAREGVGMRGPHFRSSRAMITFCTSVAPS